MSKYIGPVYFSSYKSGFEFGMRSCFWWFWWQRHGWGGKCGVHTRNWSVKFGRTKDEMFSERNNIDCKPIRFAGFSLVIKRRT